MPKDPMSSPEVAGQVPEACAVDERSIQVPGALLRLRCYRPEASHAEAQRAGLVFFHGGGFVRGDAASDEALCARLSLASGAVIVSCDYRLAPQHRFPSAVDDAYFAACYVHEHADDFGINHLRLGVAGAEVGAGLATTVARLAKERRNPALGLQVLIRPWLDLRQAQGEIEHYADARVREDPRCSPLLARNLIGLPPVVIACGPEDARAGDATAYAARLREVQVGVTQCGDPDEAEALRACARAIERAFGSSSERS